MTMTIKVIAIIPIAILMRFWYVPKPLYVRSVSKTSENTSRSAYCESVVEECNACLECPEQARCRCPTGQLDLGPNDPD